MIAGGLREAKRIDTKERIINATVELFLIRGVDKTLVDDIAATANVSRRTFFNYFSSKQEVFSDWFRCQGEHLGTSFALRPKDEAPWASLEACYLDMRRTFGQESERVLNLRRLLVTEPSLLARKHECVASTMEHLTLVVAHSLPRTKDRALRALVLVQAAVGAYNAACADWEGAPAGRPFEAVLRHAFTLAEPKVARDR